MRRTLLILLWILFAPSTTLGQTAEIIRADENLRAEPGGTIIATLDMGATLEVGELRDEWREVTLDGWIWAPSVRADQNPGTDLVVSARNGENLRVAPNGDRIARLMTGARLVELKREGRWVQVRRTAWVRNEALSIAPAASEAAVAPPADSVELPTPLAPEELAWTGQVGARLLNAPGGDTLAAIQPMAAVEVLESDGEWARIRVEGWVWAGTLVATADTGAVITGLAPEVLRSNPDGFRGRIIQWEVQFIALKRAEKIRTDFEEGELFILARPPGDQPGFVYLAVPEALAARAEALTPLERITILARVRTGRSQQMAAPILDLLEIH